MWKIKQYYLVVCDENTGLEQWRMPVMMDIANQVYDIYEINIALFKYDQPILGE